MPIMYERDSLACDTTVKEKNIDYLQENMKFSEFSTKDDLVLTNLLLDL
jgi:hypothetical protein